MRTLVLAVLVGVVLATMCAGQAMCDEGSGCRGNVTVRGYITNLPCARPVKFYPIGATSFSSPIYSCWSDDTGHFTCVVTGPAQYKIGVDNTWWCKPNVNVIKSVGYMTQDLTAQAPPLVSCSRPSPSPRTRHVRD